MIGYTSNAVRDKGRWKIARSAQCVSVSADSILKWTRYAQVAYFACIHLGQIVVPSTPHGERRCRQSGDFFSDLGSRLKRVSIKISAEKAVARWSKTLHEDLA